jgi:very-short-patch-repair endonuclease
MPLPVPQYQVVENGIPIARLDFAYPIHRLGIEADGYRWHSGVQRWQEDLRRENRLKLLGWTLLRFSWTDVKERPELVASQVRSALETLGKGSPR